MNISKESTIIDILQKNCAKNLTEEQMKVLKEFSEISSKNYDDSNVIDLDESLSYIIIQLNSGLHPSYLSNDEEDLLTAKYGEDYFKLWGYDQKELKKKCK